MPFDFAVGSDVAGRMRDIAWAGSPLGEPQKWPQALKSVVRTMLASRFAMWMAWGEELTFLCNDAYLPTVGDKRDWVIGARSERVWAEIWPDIGPRIAHVLATGEATWDEALLLYLKRAGYTEETYHTFSYSPLADDAGRINGMLCVVAEVTQRVLGERQLALLRDLGGRMAGAKSRADVMHAFGAALASEPRDLPFLLAILPDGPDRGGQVAVCHGLSPDDLATLDRQGLLDAGADPRTTRLVPLPSFGVSAERLPLAFWQIAPHQALLAPLKGADGTLPSGLLVAGLNPHRAVDADYRGFVELVAAQVAAALARAEEFERARQRAAALAEIDRAKTVFFTNISHEFRTPLTLMLGALEEALADGGLPGTARSDIQVAYRNASRLLRLVNGLLDFSRLEAGRVEAVYEPVDLAALTTDLASTFRSAFDRAGLALDVDCSALRAPCAVDREMWEKIVLNLLSNAFKFTLEGGVRVRLVPDGDTAVLEIADTGVGIPEHELPHLFERFHRIEGSRGRSLEGSGIGLALVRDLVTLHGGTIEVERREDGTTFRVRLPLRSVATGDVRASEASRRLGEAQASAFVEEALRWLPEPETRSPPAATTGPTETGHGAHLVFADDNADLRAYVSRLLESAGFRVTAVADGEAALEALRRRRPDLLLTDVMMPGLDGFGLLASVRGDPALSDLPVILLSARAGEDARVEGLAASADDYLAKPFSARELIARVGVNVKMAEVRRQAALAVAESEERLRLAIEVGRLAAWDWNMITGEIAWSDEHYVMLGYAKGAITPSFKAWSERLHPEDRAGVEHALRQARETHTVYEHEYRVLHQSGEERFLKARGRYIRDADGRSVRMIGAALDVTDRRRWEERQKVLIGELQHRTRNLMSVISAISEMALRSSADMPEFAAKLRDRLSSLARTQRLLSRLDESERLTFDRLLQEEVASLGASKDRVTLRGPEGISLKSNAVQTLAMALHELATNAVKYGALSTSGGRLAITWDITHEEQQPWLNVDWVESGVVMPPQTEAGVGSGRTLIERALPYQLGARTHFAMGADGVRCTIGLPVTMDLWDWSGERHPPVEH